MIGLIKPLTLRLTSHFIMKPPISLTPLLPNDGISLICPGSAIEKHELDQLCQFVENLGFTPLPGKHILASMSPYYADNDTGRYNDLVDAFESPSSKAIWCLRGGFGSTRIIPQLLEMKIPKNPKLLIGFSDITALHTIINQHWQWPTLHAPVLLQYIKKAVQPDYFNQVRDILLGKIKTHIFTNLTPLNNVNQGQPFIEGTLCGGNLSILQTSLGTPWQFNPNKTILFIEEIGEKGYAIDRMLNHLNQAITLSSCRAILFGDMLMGITPEQDKEEADRINFALQYFAQMSSVPVFKVTGIGHGKHNTPLPLGTMATIETQNSKINLTCSSVYTHHK